jgi:hypothetical protein
VRVNLRELLKAAKNGDSGKVRSLGEKANTCSSTSCAAGG